jgi:hypothetical protein
MDLLLLFRIEDVIVITKGKEIKTSIVIDSCMLVAAKES